MDIFSYLLGKKAGGGGGGSGEDWSLIGYSEEPQEIQDGYDYAVDIMENWDATSTMESKFSGDKKLIFMPLVDISQKANLTRMFDNCHFLMSVPALDYSKAVSLDYMFNNCLTLKTISNFNAEGRLQYTFVGCSQLETVQGNIKPTSLRLAFSNCTNLKNIPIIDASSISNNSSGFQKTFQNCVSLTDTSLDNILQTCISATSYTGTKTLVQLGFNSTNYPVSRIEALPHYQDFINAGWTIGY